jgi:hypothetical protein
VTGYKKIIVSLKARHNVLEELVTSVRETGAARVAARRYEIAGGKSIPTAPRAAPDDRPDPIYDLPGQAFALRRRLKSGE